MAVPDVFIYTFFTHFLPNPAIGINIYRGIIKPYGNIQQFITVL